MNNLAACSKVLYDREVIQKNKEVFELKKRIKELEEKYKKPNINSKFHNFTSDHKWAEDFDDKLRVLLCIFTEHYQLNLNGGYNISYDTNFPDIVKLFEDKFGEYVDKTDSEWSKRICGTYLAPIIIFLDTFVLDDIFDFEEKLFNMFQNIRSEIIYEEINILNQYSLD